MPATPQLPRNVHPGDTLVVVHDFDARGADELTLRRGEKLELLELDDGFGDGWYLGKHLSDGRTGLFPGVYTAASPKIGAREPSSSAVAADAHDTESSSVSSSSLQEKDGGPVSPMLNDDPTPQPSRHASASGIDASDIDKNGSKFRQLSSVNSAPSLNSSVQRTISETMESRNDEDSPVINETLSVIDEHITDLSTPRHSFVAPERHITNDSGSEYSNHIDHRVSYIPGAETDEEEESEFNEADVRSWNHKETARHLRDLGIDPKHCDIFEEQEITGDVLLEMDRDFLFMKDFDFGVMGKRLRTWHAIRAFQEEVKGPARLMHSSHGHHDRDGMADDYGSRSQSRAGTTGPLLPKIPSLTEDHGHGPRRQRSVSSPKSSGLVNNVSSPLSPLTHSSSRDSTTKPSAASIRQLNHSRRHSSIDNNTPNAAPRAASAMSNFGRQKKSSFDRGWTMSGSVPGTRSGDNISESPVMGDATDDLDRGYFSGGEIDARKSRNVLKKRDSATRSYSHSRQPSATNDPKQVKLHSRFANVDSIRDSVPDIKQGKGKFGDLNGHSPKPSGQFSHSPTVTNLESSTTVRSGFFSAFSPHTKADADHSGRSSPLPSANLKNVAPKMRRAIGLRAISDAVTGHEKSSLSSPTSASSSKDLPKSPTRTNSSTPSATSKSLDLESGERSPKPGDGAFGLMARPKMPPSARSKSKKDTSAYTRGLEKKTPQEQMVGCDYCGWMKKKSSNLMTTWKPRLFVLRGRRLSYYYSENDTEERGLIDISSHRVFRADQDTITALHATITGARGSPTSPGTHGPSAPADGDNSSNSSARRKIGSPDSHAPFIFKLVPPKAGIQRAVQFTKPSIHFFQVDNIQEGRLWMAALTKATIERDLNLPVRTTNKQKTISLKQAMATNQRPPALIGSEIKEISEEKEKDPEPENGKAISSSSIGRSTTNSDSDITSVLKGFDEVRAVSPTLLADSITDSKHD